MNISNMNQSLLKSISLRSKEHLEKISNSYNLSNLLSPYRFSIKGSLVIWKVCKRKETSTNT